jgi:class 3 adenylate cyclase/TolB-like protein/cytochrome c-type biogenesis protein CcmH/NrfG
VAALKRKLTTILCADVSGYGLLMSRAEETTHARLAALLREVIEPAIAAHGGTLIKTTGDGLLAEFASVVEAVRCATEIQQSVGERNSDYPRDQNIAFRMGINLGDVIHDNDDIFGDGVIVASRLEALAEPGGIVVSQSVRDHVHEKLELRFEEMGEQRLKNMERPVLAFRVRGEADLPQERHGLAKRRLRNGAIALTGALSIAVIAGSWWLGALASLSAWTAPLLQSASLAQILPAPRPPQLSIVVLPFANLGGDPQQDYFVDGITESLTTDLSRALPGSFVVTRGTAFTYKGKPVDARQIGRDLNVHYLLQGSVLTDGDQVRVNAWLTGAADNAELWAERFDKKRQNVLEIQDQIVGRLSRAVGLELVDIEAKRSEHASDPTAVDFVMRGQAIANRPSSPQKMIAARWQFQRALEYDPNNVDALAGLASTYVFEVLNSYYEDGREQRLRDGKALVRHALAVDARHIVALKVRAALYRAQGEFDDAIAASQVVIAQNPGEPWAYKEVGLSKLYLGRFDEAMEWFDKANQIGPRDPSRWIWLAAMGRVGFFLGHNEEAIRLLRLSIDANPNDVQAFALLAAVYAVSERQEDAGWALTNCLRLRPELTIKRFFADWPVPLQATSPVYREQHERLRGGLRLAGMPLE